jgi:hypothetical protein
MLPEQAYMAIHGRAGNLTSLLLLLLLLLQLPAMAPTCKL